MGWDTSRYLTLFVGEATEHLESLSKQLVLLEQGASQALVDAMFRHSHSVKGMALSMGLEATARLAHSLEDLLDALRLDISRVEKGHVDLAFQAVDALQTQVRATAEGTPPAESSALIEALSGATGRLNALRVPKTLTPTPDPLPAMPPPGPAAGPGVAPTSSEGEPAAPGEGEPGPGSRTAPSSEARRDTPAEAAPAAAAAPDGAMPPRFSIRLKVAPTATQPGVRGFLAYKRLSTLGNVFDLKPSLDDVKSGRIAEGIITLELETNELEADVRRTLKTIADVELDSLKEVASVFSPAAAAPLAEPEPRPVGQEPTRTVRVKADLLDELLEDAGELLLATGRVREISRALTDPHRSPLDESVDKLHSLVRGLHGKVMQARMTPLAVITDRLPRAARDIARRRGREVELLIAGADIELDRSIVDDLADPLLHLLRNSVDHGVEPPEERRLKGKNPRGRVTVTVRRVRDHVELEVADDGRGMDPERLKLIATERGLITAEQAGTMGEREALLLCCLPGVSTASDVTDISGRGVGMDAVRRLAEQVGGSLEIESSRGRGTRFVLSLPLTVAVVNLLLVGVGEEVFGLPIAKVSAVVEEPRGSLSRSENAPVLHFGRSVLAVHELARLLNVEGQPKDGSAPFVVVEGDTGHVALSVDRLLGQEEVVLKALSRPLDLVPGLAGVTILGSGRPVFILDVARLVAP